MLHDMFLNDHFEISDEQKKNSRNVPFYSVFTCKMAVKVRILLKGNGHFIYQHIGLIPFDKLS